MIRLIRRLLSIRSDDELVVLKGHWIDQLPVLTAVSLVLVICTGTAIAASDGGVCPYRTFYVEIKSGVHRGHRENEAEHKRIALLDIAASALHDIGMTKVDEQSDSSWILKANGQVDQFENQVFDLSIAPRGNISHHLYVIQMDDPHFDVGGALGFSMRVSTGMNPSIGGDFRREVFDTFVSNWKEQEAVRVSKLCRRRAELIDEGWAEIEELRLALMKEMDRVRRERKRETQRKRLRIEIED